MRDTDYSFTEQHAEEAHEEEEHHDEASIMMKMRIMRA